MPRPVDFRVVGRPGLSGWLMILVAVSLIVAVAVAIAVVAIGVFLFLLPLLVVAAALYYLFGRTTFRRRYKQGKTPMIIDGEFRRVDPSDMERTRGQD